MARVFITGSTQGVGRVAAEQLLAQGHQVVLHARDDSRRDAVKDLTERGADVVVGELSQPDQVRGLVEQVNQLGAMDAVVNNAGVWSGPELLPVNLVAPYLLSALLERPRRLVFLSSSMHRGGRPRLTGLDLGGTRETASYSDSKLLVTVLSLALARRWPQRIVQAMDPGWVPTRMGGESAPDDLGQGSDTAAWLAVTDDPAALASGGYWLHRRREEPHPASTDRALQDELLDALAAHTGVALP